MSPSVFEFFPEHVGISRVGVRISAPSKDSNTARRIVLACLRSRQHREAGSPRWGDLAVSGPVPALKWGESLRRSEPCLPATGCDQRLCYSACSARPAGGYPAAPDAALMPVALGMLGSAPLPGEMVMAEVPVGAGRDRAADPRAVWHEAADGVAPAAACCDDGFPPFAFLLVRVAVACRGGLACHGQWRSRPISAASATMPTSTIRIHACTFVTADLRSGTRPATVCRQSGRFVKDSQASSATPPYRFTR
jgi:hypothetical protein